MSLQLPSAPIEALSSILASLTLPVHPLIPYARFPVLHAVRVSLVWAGMTCARNKDPGVRKKVGVLQDLFGYLVVAWGGATISSLLLSRPPAWLFSPIPWIIYPSIYLLFLHLLSPLPLARIITTLLPSTLLDIIGAYIDGITRGSTVAILTSSLSLPPGNGKMPGQEEGGIGALGAAVLSSVAISGGGWMVQTLGLNLPEWRVGTPAVLSNGAGVLDTLDTWSAVFCSIIYSILIAPGTAGTSTSSQGERSTAVISPAIDNFVRGLVPSLPTSGEKGGIYANANGLETTTTARSVVVLLMGSILAARVITKLVLANRQSTPKVTAAAEVMVTGSEKEMEKEAVESAGSRTATPRKRKGTPKKSPGPK